MSMQEMDRQNHHHLLPSKDRVGFGCQRLLCSGQFIKYQATASLPLGCAGPRTSRNSDVRAAWATLAGTAGTLVCCQGRSPTGSKVRIPCTSCTHPCLELWLEQRSRHHCKDRPSEMQQRTGNHLSEAKTPSSSSSHCGRTANKTPRSQILISSTGQIRTLQKPHSIGVFLQTNPHIYPLGVSVCALRGLSNVRILPLLHPGQPHHTLHIKPYELKLTCAPVKWVGKPQSALPLLVVYNFSALSHRLPFFPFQHPLSSKPSLECPNT